MRNLFWKLIRPVSQLFGSYTYKIVDKSRNPAFAYSVYYLYTIEEIYHPSRVLAYFGEQSVVTNTYSGSGIEWFCIYTGRKLEFGSYERLKEAVRLLEYREQNLKRYSLDARE